MFADYRVPQALAYLGALEYSPELMELLRSGKHLPNGSPEEVELRGASIWVCEVRLLYFPYSDFSANKSLILLNAAAATYFVGLIAEIYSVNKVEVFSVLFQMGSRS